MQSSLSVLSLSGISETLLSVVSATTPARMLHDATHVSSVTQPEPAHTAWLSYDIIQMQPKHFFERVKDPLQQSRKRKTC